MPNEIHSHMRWNLYTFLVKHFSLTGWQSFAVMAGCLLLCMVIPYLLGSFNFGLIISRRKYHDDIRINGHNQHAPHLRTESRRSYAGG